jgi:hypothetical protein
MHRLGPQSRRAWALLLGSTLAVGTLAAPAAVADAACRASAPQPEAKRKFNPGHYVTIGRHELRSGVNVNAVLGKGLTGVQLRYSWANLEPEEGRYDFSVIERDLGR